MVGFISFYTPYAGYSAPFSLKADIINMLSSYKAVLNNNHLEWFEQIPTQLKSRTVTVYVTILDELPIEKPELTGQKAIDILQKIADNGGPGIDDPVAWQREIRQDNPLLGRE